VIFFIVTKKQRENKDWKALTDGSPGGALDYTVDGADGWVIIAWNEVFPTLADLKKGVDAVARLDPVCLDIRAQAIARFGIDPFLEQCTGGNVDLNTMTKIVDKTFFYWAHPCIGNLTQSPNRRPSPFGPESLLNWSGCGLLDQETKAAIELLARTLGPIDRSRRDQARICTNVTELARAIIGEIACEASRRLEKLFALRLCRSPLLLQKQQELLLAMLAEHEQWLVKKFDKFKWASCQYTKYYLGEPNEDDQWPLFATLLDDATGGVFLKTKFTLSTGAQAKFKTWKMLPGPIRCAVLMNDLRKVADYVPQPPSRTSMCMPKETLLPLPGGTDPVYGIGSAADPLLGVLKKSPWGFAWSWSRDEYAIPTRTYRHFLCPLWAGASGHTAGALMFWTRAIIGPKKGFGLTFAQNAAVATGLFTVWRLYFDKRVSANHTLAETFEATCLPFATSNVQLSVPDNELLRISPDEDAYRLIELCLEKRGGFFVDPILLLRSIGASYVRGATFAEKFAALDTDIDNERIKLSVEFTVPVWSWTLDQSQGLETKSFAQKYLSLSVSPLSSVTLMPTPSDTLNQALTILTTKDDEETKKDGD
jgi:hypothetical protein